MRPSSLQEGFIGCLLGLSIGDALGMPFEGMTAEALQVKLSRPLQLFDAPWRGLKAGQWTDDTKMALCLAESLAENRGLDPEDVARRYVAWYDSGDLRGIGATTQEAILRLKAGIPWSRSGKTGTWAAGNGAAMRVAPLGLFFYRDLERLQRACQLEAAITHNNPEAIAGSQAVAFMVASLLAGGLDLHRLIQETVGFIGEGTVSERLRQAEGLLQAGVPCAMALKELGTSGYVVETVASAAYCFLTSPDDFEQTVTSAVLGGGDTDTTAAIAGALSGAWNGVQGIPPRWRERVEDAERIEKIALALWQATVKRS